MVTVRIFGDSPEAPAAPTVRSRTLELCDAARRYEEQVIRDVVCAQNATPDVVRRAAFTTAKAIRELCEALRESVDAQQALDAELSGNG